MSGWRQGELARRAAWRAGGVLAKRVVWREARSLLSWRQFVRAEDSGRFGAAGAHRRGGQRSACSGGEQSRRAGRRVQNRGGQSDREEEASEATCDEASKGAASCRGVKTQGEQALGVQTWGVQCVLSRGVLRWCAWRGSALAVESSCRGTLSAMRRADEGELIARADSAS